MHKNQKYFGQYFFVFVTSVRKPKTKLSESDIQYFEFSFPCHPVLESALNLFWTFITVFVPAGEWA